MAVHERPKARRIAVLTCGQPPPELYEKDGTYGVMLSQHVLYTHTRKSEARSAAVSHSPPPHPINPAGPKCLRLSLTRVAGADHVQ